MSETTGIAWTDHTFNPWIGCARVSEGCRNCYAEREARRYFKGRVAWGTEGARHVTTSTWADPVRFNQKAVEAGVRRRVFCASWADVFEAHPVADATRPRLWQLVRETPGLDWLILTKRPERIGACLPADWGSGWPHVWLGTTVENRAALGRLATLRSIPAVVRFVSCEPLLEDLGDINLDGVAWLIVGGETGAEARYMKPEWARALRDRCASLDVAFFMKQMTKKGPIPADLFIREWPAPAQLDLLPGEVP